MKKTILILLVIVFSFSSTFGQSYRKQQDQILAYNILTNALIAGISGAVNKKKGEKLHHAFLKNFGKGGLGGIVKYTAKYQTFYLRYEQSTITAPLNRVLFFAGHSMVMNASLNEPTFKNLYFNYFGFNFKYDTQAEKGTRLSTKLSATTFSSAIFLLNFGDRFNFYKTLEYGFLFFDLHPDAQHPSLVRLDGRSIHNSLAIREFNGQHQLGILPHEILHTYQAYDFFALSNIYKEKEQTILNKSKVYRFASKYVDFDYEPIFFTTLYNTQPKPTYFKNFFEYEAEHFSGRKYINR